MKKNKLSRSKIVIMLVILVIFVLFLSTIGYSYYLFSKVKVVDIDRKEITNNQFNNYVDENIINICIIGSDAYSEKEYSADSIIILTVDKVKQNIKLTSLMRDIYVKNPENNNMFNLNEAMILGGHELLLKTINYNFNLSIDKFVEANLSSFPKIIDNIGGIKVNIEEYEINEINKFIKMIDINNGTSTNLIVSGGEQILNGTQVSAYCRVRSESGRDDVRTQKQRYIISCILNEVKSSKVLKIPSMMNDILPLIKTNLKSKEFIEIGIIFLKLGSIEINQIKFPLDGEYKMLLTEGDKFHLSIDIQDTAKKINNFIYSVE